MDFLIPFGVYLKFKRSQAGFRAAGMCRAEPAAISAGCMS